MSGSIVAAADIDYARDIQPLLAAKCAACHGGLRQEAGLRLDHGGLLRQGSDSGQIIDLQAPADSVLLERVSTEDDSSRMPPPGEGEALTTEQIQLLSAWITAGAHSPEDEAIPPSPDEHWAFHPPQQVSLPLASIPMESATDSRNAAREGLTGIGNSGNPIDAFIAAKYSSQGLQPLPLADRRARLRRLYYDLIGLPPTLAEQQSFLADDSPDAWSRLVDRLLENPAYGQRWARHWMDVWRYSDWDGYKEEVRGSQRHIWRWRDWIVRSLNADKGYDRMVVEMLAGDEVAPLDREVLPATGFLVRNFHRSNRDIWLDATVEHTAKAFLGLTINCARCHDHKYDPVGQTEYYAFRAIFEPHHVRTERVAGQANLQKDGLVRAYDAEPEAATYLYIAGNEKTPDKDHPIAPAAPSVIRVPFEIQPVELPTQAVFPSLMEFIEREDLAAVEQRLAKAKQALMQTTATASDLEHRLAIQAVVVAQSELESLRARWAADKTRYADGPVDEALVVKRSQAAIAAEHRAKLALATQAVFQREQELTAAEAATGDEKTTEKADKSSEVEKARKALESARQELAKAQMPPATDATYTSVGDNYPTYSTGRRLALANWIVDRQNPLAARVAVNHLWLHYFGEPLVPNVFDFGLRSPAPPHQDLLDWLAVELMEHDWSLKHVQRLIANSLVYQLASHTADQQLLAQNSARDPDNLLLWRANVRRLDAEVIRDSLLSVGGNLDVAQGGPDIDFDLGEEITRRSLYFRHAYEKQMKMLVLFDAAGPQECYRRSESVIPQQALVLANSPLAIDQARRLAQLLWKKTAEVEIPFTTDADAQPEDNWLRQQRLIQLAFQTLIGRECTAEELQVCQSFLARQTELLQDEQQLTKLPGTSKSQTQASPEPAARARENLIHTLINHNDFVTLR